MGNTHKTVAFLCATFPEAEYLLLFYVCLSSGVFLQFEDEKGKTRYPTSTGPDIYLPLLIKGAQ